MALVSIVMPAYAAERFIAAALDSVRAQSMDDWECLVVDDASPDRTAEIAAAAAAADSRFRLLRQPENRGVAAARNAALAAATGRYVAFLDADDLWLPAKLERQVGFMRESGAGMSYTAFRRIDESGARVGRLIAAPPRMTWQRLLKNTAIATLTVMLDREKTGPVQMTAARRDDMILWLTLMQRGVVALGLNEDLARYRVVRGSLSSRRVRAAGWVWDVYREQAGLGRLRSLWSLGHYAAHAYLKRLRF